MSTGVVMRSTGSRYVVRAADGVLHDCVAKGNLRIKGWNSTNPLAVGDHVDFIPPGNEEEVGAIMELHNRRNYLVRRSVNLSHHKHVIAANIDLLLMFVTVARPRTSFGFIDRMLVTAEVYQVPAVVVVNKIDDLDDEEQERLFDLVDVYQEAGYRVVMTSALKGKGIAEVKALIMGKVTLLAGHSGVGKSTLINAIDPELDLFTLEVSESSGKGVHTTTNAEMYELRMASGELASGKKVPRGQLANTSLATPSAHTPTFIIDTPGIKGFGLVDIDAAHIGDQFPEMFRLKGGCKFNDCMHKEEPGCSIRKAVEEGAIAESRYNSYVDMVNGVEDESSFRVD